MSSPARSSASATSGGQGGGGGGGGGAGIGSFGDDASPYHFPPDIISVYDRKDEALAALKSELIAALQKEVKSLDEDAWKFAGPRSQIHRISRPERQLTKQTGGTPGEVNQLTKQTRSLLR